MSSEVDIVNLALSKIGDQATVTAINPPDSSAQAGHAAIFYPIARDFMLDQYNWAFATRRTTLAKLASAPAFGWTYAYGAPAQALNLLAVHLEGWPDDSNPQPFEHESLDDGSEVIYTNVDNAALRYTVFVTDTAKFDPAFVDALSWLLGAHLAGPVIKGAEGRATAAFCMNMFKIAYAAAQSSDASNRMVRPTHYPEHLRARTGLLAQNPPTAG